MVFTWDAVLYLLGVAMLWGGMRQELKSLREDFARLRTKVDMHNNLKERLSIAERDILGFYRFIEEWKEDKK